VGRVAGVVLLDGQRVGLVNRCQLAAVTLMTIVSVAIAAASFVVNLWIGQRTAVRPRKPVLAFVDDPEHKCWVLPNVGNGPALKVLVAQRGSGARRRALAAYQGNRLPKWAENEIRRYWELRPDEAIAARWSVRSSGFRA
jgi:hypothetical protein